MRNAIFRTIGKTKRHKILFTMQGIIGITVHTTHISKHL